jgi:acyl dehydratase
MSLDTLAGPEAERSEPATFTQHQLRDLAGQSLGHSRWHHVTQADIDRFAIATGDFQWIHTDPDRASRGPFSSTIAHGYLTLSLATTLICDVLEVTDAALIVNYGLDRVRFPAPLPADSPVRAEICCQQVREVPGGIELTLRLTYQVRGQDKPCCVADVLYRYYDEPAPVAREPAGAVDQ